MMENAARIVADDILSFHRSISATAKSGINLSPFGLWNINELASNGLGLVLILNKPSN